MKFLRSTKDRRPLFELKIYKRHLLIFLAVIVLAIFGYGIYFRAYMTLPQAAINVLSDFPFSLQNQKILIVSPHCDDEILSSGGLIQQALVEKSEVKVAIGTNCNKRGIGKTRQQESIDALATVGLPSSNIVFWNLPEIPNENAIKQNEDNYKKLFSDEIKSYVPTLVILPHPNETHVDHAMMGRVGEQVLSEQTNKINTAFYLIHYNFLKYPSPSGLTPESYLLPPAKLINTSGSWYKLPLSENEETIKEDAILKYKSQLRISNPVLHRILLDFVRKNELFMVRN